MITTIVLTAIATAAICITLLHRRNAYVYRVEETSLERAEEIELLTAELVLQQDLVTGMIASNAVYRAQIKGFKSEIAELQRINDELR